MTLDRIDVTPLRLPFETRQAMSPDWMLDGLYVALVQLRDSSGAEGLGYACVVNRRYLAPLVAMVRGLAEMLEGADPDTIEQHWRRMRADVGVLAVEGLGQMAIAALDIALWDLRGRRLGQPVHRLLGSSRDRLPCYASTYFVGVRTADDHVRLAQELVAKGFRAMKLGTPPGRTPERRAAPLRAMREALGADVGLMVDCFQRLTAAEAMALGRALEPVGLDWFEDPMPVEDVAGCAALAAALDTPVTLGESLYADAAFRQVIDARATDILMLDLLRVGGFTGWRRIALLAETAHLPVVSHLMTEVSAHALAATPHGLTLEYSPWTFPLFATSPELDERGEVRLGDAPGLGLELAPDALARFRLD